MPCFSYTLHCTPYTENKKYFLCFFLYLPKGIYLCLFTIFPRPRAYLIYIHAKPTRRQASKQPSGYTLRLRLYTRSKAYTEANANNGHTASPTGNG